MGARDCRAVPWAVILAGGAGRRLAATVQELEGRATPKQFCRFGQEKSLLQETLHRIRPLIPTERTVVVVTKPFGSVARAQLRRSTGVTVIEQPTNRGTAPGLLLPVARIHRRDRAATILVLPADHGVASPAMFRAGLSHACRTVNSLKSRVVLGGVRPTFASSDYGWIVPVPGGAIERYKTSPVERFVEKPSRVEAEALYAAGALWSTFVLVAKSATLMDLFACHVPRLTSDLRRWAALRSEDGQHRLAEIYERLRSKDFSSSLLSRAQELEVLCWPEAIGWTDLGTPARLSEWLRQQQHSVVTKARLRQFKANRKKETR